MCKSGIFDTKPAISLKRRSGAQVATECLQILVYGPLTLSAHVSALCRAGYYQLRQLRPLVQWMMVDAARTATGVYILPCWTTVIHCCTVCQTLYCVSCSLCRMPQHDWSLAHDAVITSHQYYVTSTQERIKLKVAYAWFASRCLGRKVTAVLFLTVPNAHCGQRTFRLAWCREHSAATMIELLQPQDPACGTLFQSNYAIRTPCTDCSNDSWRHTFFGQHERYGALWLWYAAP